MDPIQLRREIEDEMRRTRLDKARLYDLLLKIVDTSVGGEASAGPAGPQGPAGPAGECKCAKVETPAPAPVVPKNTTAKKTTATKKSTA